MRHAATSVRDAAIAFNSGADDADADAAGDVYDAAAAAVAAAAAAATAAAAAATAAATISTPVRITTVAQAAVAAERAAVAERQGLTLVHFSAQLEPCLTHENTLHTINTP